MQLLISDANILIDIEVGGLIASMFSLDYRFAVPDVIFYEELEEQHAYLLDMGLESKGLDEHMVLRVMALASQYPRPSRNDLFALVLAANEGCPLLTGDKALKVAAESENVEVHGTLWLINEMTTAGKISVQVARGAYQLMRNNGRRLPWDRAEQLLAQFEATQSDKNRTYAKAPQRRYPSLPYVRNVCVSLPCWDAFA